MENRRGCILNILNILLKQIYFKYNANAHTPTHAHPLTYHTYPRAQKEIVYIVYNVFRTCDGAHPLPHTSVYILSKYAREYAGIRAYVARTPTHTTRSTRHNLMHEFE